MKIKLKNKINESVGHTLKLSGFLETDRTCSGITVVNVQTKNWRKKAYMRNSTLFRLENDKTKLHNPKTE